MRLGDLDALSAFVGDLRSTLHKEQSTFKAMTQSEFEIKDSMLLSFQYAIDNAPTVELTETEIQEVLNKRCMTAVANEYLIALHGKRPQGEYVDISKLRLMTVEECAGHTIDYAMGWKACIEWIKKGGAK